MDAKCTRHPRNSCENWRNAVSIGQFTKGSSKNSNLIQSKWTPLLAWRPQIIPENTSKIRRDRWWESKRPILHRTCKLETHLRAINSTIHSLGRQPIKFLEVSHHRLLSFFNNSSIFLYIESNQGSDQIVKVEQKDKLPHLGLKYNSQLSNRENITIVEKFKSISSMRHRGKG